jgi:predicted SnoaL-like aldol condensation-catalyzing enzyme
MSPQKKVLQEIAQVIEAGGPFRTEKWFTADFRLIEPAKPNWPRGYEGANKLLELFRTLTPPLQFTALDMIEEGDRIAVRWQLSVSHNGEPLHIASMAIYRFQDERIAEDWGIPIRGEWLD